MNIFKRALWWYGKKCCHFTAPHNVIRCWDFSDFLYKRNLKDLETAHCRLNEPSLSQLSGCTSALSLCFVLIVVLHQIDVSQVKELFIKLKKKGVIISHHNAASYASVHIILLQKSDWLMCGTVDTALSFALPSSMKAYTLRPSSKHI